jgi:endo-1,4-beta-xylanase
MKKISKKSFKIIISTIAVVVIISISIIIPIFWIPATYNIILSKPIHSGVSVPIGFAVNVPKMKNDVNYSAIGLYHFNSFTPENVMKMRPLQPKEGEFFWDDADYLVSLAENNSIPVHGHCLLWHEAVPNWMENYNGTKEQWRQMLKTHIQTVVGRYKGRIVSWDVVNEAFESDGFRETIWYTNIGKDYIKDAFIWAHEADPDAILYYNDFSISENNKKLNHALTYINNSIGEGVPIHGLGFQAHHTYDSPTVADIKSAVELVNLYNIKVRVSELDIKMNNKDLYHAYTKTLMDKQSERYSQVVEAYSHANNLTGITLWGFGDSFSWLRNSRPLEWPLLFDDQYNPKPCALSFKNALDQYFSQE